MKGRVFVGKDSLGLCGEPARKVLAERDIVDVEEHVG
jgi:hypothetical protein